MIRAFVVGLLLSGCAAPPALGDQRAEAIRRQSDELDRIIAANRDEFEATHRVELSRLLKGTP